MKQSQSAKLVDPFEGFSILSLNPRTFLNSEDSLKSNDLEAIHQHMTAMALQNPDKHFEEASSVLNGGLEFLSNKENEADLKENKHPRGNRPALPRKRAKFRMMPDTSQPHTIEEPVFQFDQSMGPDEFFAAYAKFETTKKELKRLKGEDVNEAKISTTVRQRRPELPRRRATFNHYIYSSQPENDTSLSQETLLGNIGCPPTQNFEQESVNPDCQSREEQNTGSVTKTENRVQDLFDELMSSDIAKLNDDEAMLFMKDRLKIKTFERNNLRLPDSNDFPKVDLVSSVTSLIKDHSILFHTHTSPDRLKGITPVKFRKLSNNPLLPLASPKSPFLAISTLGKNISKSIESNDPFSAHDIASFPATTSEIVNEHLTHVSKEKDSLGSGSLPSLVKNKVTETLVHEKLSAEALTSSPECHNMEERDLDDNETGSYVVTGIQTNKDIQENDEDMVQKAAYTTKPNVNVEHITTDIDIDTVDPHCIEVIEEKVEGVTHKTGSSTSPEVNVEISTMEDLNTQGSQSAETDANSAEDLNSSRRDQNLDIVPVQLNEEQAHLNTTLKKRKKSTRARKVDLKKRRRSLAEAGTSWKSGVRRSNRIRRKPLDYWKGERLLYGRIHNSLPTVIGVKYLSSNNNGEPSFIVESFVDEKYKDLVEFAALH